MSTTTVDAKNYCYTSDGWSRIVASGETEGSVSVRTESHEMMLDNAFWAMRDYPHAGYQIRIDLKNKLAFVRVPPRTLAEERDDVGRHFKITHLIEL